LRVRGTTTAPDPFFRSLLFNKDSSMAALITNPNAGEEMVLTPGGLRPKSKVHFLEEGQRISGKGGRMRIIETATGREIKDLGPTSTKKRPEHLARVKPPDRKTVPALTDIGWIENSQWQNTSGQPIVYFSTKWVVPPVPASDDGQIIFLFNGLEPANGSYILQPVLQWGAANGTGKYWSISNWYANGESGHSITKLPIQVNPGDVLQGVMTLTGKSGSEFSYHSSFVGYPGVDIDSGEVDELTWAYVTLEAYGSADETKPVPQCSDYPNIPLTAFYDIEIKTGASLAMGNDATVSWGTVTNHTDCGQRVAIVSNASPEGSVYLYYRQVALNAGLYDRYDQVNNSADSGYPTPTSEAWSGMSFTDRVDAAFTANSHLRPGKAYFFRDDMYIRYDLPTMHADPGYPIKISERWSGMSFTDRVDAVFKYDAGPYPGKAFFFRDDECICYDLNTEKADPGYPKKISAVFPTLAFQDRVDAVVKFDAGIHAGKAYFFRDDEYIRYDLATNLADSSYPAKISAAWSGMPFTDKVKAAINYEVAPRAGKVYFFKTGTST
jgi:Hemopexin